MIINVTIDVRSALSCLDSAKPKQRPQLVLVSNSEQDRFTALDVNCQPDAHQDEGERSEQARRHRAINARSDQRVGFARGSGNKVHRTLWDRACR